MLIQRSVQHIVGFYDFASDPSAGAVGSIDLQIPVPNNTLITYFCVFVVTAPTSAGGLAKISFDTINNSVSPATTTVGGLMTAALVGVFLINTVQFGVDSSGIDLTPFKTASPISIGMSISVEPLLTGQLQLLLKGVTYDF